MSDTLRPINIFISSPSDIKEERRRVIKVIDRLNKLTHISDRFALRALNYKDDVPGVVGTPPQTTVDKYLSEARDSDLLICILWSRMGTPLTDPLSGKKYKSGTEYEFLTSYESFNKRSQPRILLYRSMKDVPMNSDSSQIETVKEFFRNFQGDNASFKGLYSEYDDFDTFEDKLLNDINNILARDFSAPPKIVNAQAEIIQTRSVSEALNNLGSMMQDTEVKEAVTIFENDFKETSTQIELLGAYKDLHDWLHIVQLQCYERILAEINRFPDDDDGRDSLLEYKLTLGRMLQNIETVSGRPVFSQIETAGLIRDLKKASEKLHAALDNADRRQLNDAALLLARVLGNYPVRLNIRLNEAAKTLRLPSLIRAMTIIRDKLPGFSVDQIKAIKFSKGVDDLSKLNSELNMLIREHDNWQNADTEIQLIQIRSEQFIQDIDFSWPSIKSLVEPLYNASNEVWASEIRMYGEKLELGLSEHNPGKIKESFRSFRRLAGLRFFDVDVQLKFLCSNLRSVGDPLVSVLDMID